MVKLNFRFSQRIFAIVLAVLMVVSVCPISAFAVSSGTVSVDIADKTHKVGIATEFTVTITANEDADTLVVGTSSFSDASAVESLEFYDADESSWLPCENIFDSTQQFTLADAVKKYRVKFNKAGEFTFQASINNVDGGATVCSTEESFTVAGKTLSTLTSDIGEKDFVVGEPTEFTFTTTANDYAGVMVVGTSNFSKPDAVEKLEYYEVNNNEWYTLTGDFGPSTGFRMSDATSRFRVTFKEGGDYSFTASMKYADGEHKGEVLCSSSNIEFHVKSKYNVTVNKTEGGIVKFDGTPASETGKILTEGQSLSLSVEADDGYEISSVSIGGVACTVTDTASYSDTVTVTDSDIVVEVAFVKVYTVKVSYEKNYGAVVTDPASTGGEVTVITGTDVTVTATPNEAYRVSKVEITGKEDLVYSDNTYNHDNPYREVLKADKDYDVVITFSPLRFNINVSTSENGSVTVNKNTVEYGENGIIATVSAADGYTIDTAEVNGVSVYSQISETENDSVFTFTLNDIKEDKNIVVTFKLSEKAAVGDISWNKTDALRSDEENNLYVFADTTTVQFTTEKQGIRITDKSGNTYGGKNIKELSFSNSVSIDKIELRYDFGWHTVSNGETPVEIKIVYDKAAPSLEVKTAEEPNSNGYFTENVGLIITAKDNGDYSGIDYIEYTVECDGVKATPVKINQSEEQKNNDKFEINDVEIVASENDSDKVKVYVKVFDLAGNEKNEEISLKICTVKPSVDIVFDDEQSADADPEKNWYNKNRTATVTITDRSDVFDETVANNGVSFGDKSVNNCSISSWQHDGNTHTATITFSDEGEYSWDYAYSNKAGLTASVMMRGENAKEFAIDKTSPNGTITAHSEAWNGDGIDWSVLLNKITFGLYSNKSVSVGLKGNAGTDNLSGFYNVTYYVSNSDEVLSESQLIELYSNSRESFTTAPVVFDEDDSEQFAVYARITDNAGNVKYIGTNGVIYDVSASEITITVADEANENSFYGINNVKTYKDSEENKFLGIKTQISVNENGTYYSGIKSVDFVVTCGGVTTQNGNLFKFNNENPTKAELVNTWNGEVIINAEANNGENVVLKITVTDNADNKSTQTVTLKEINLDDIKSTVMFTGPKAVKTENGFGWYNNEREAVIIIEDRASTFDETAATQAIKVTATDKDGNTIQNKNVTIGQWNNNGDMHTVNVTFGGDGKYSWEIDYTNKAGNKLSADKIVYGSSESPTAFTVDKTAPTGSIKIGEYTWKDRILSVLTFGIYSKSAFDISVVAADTGDISPIKVEYYKHVGANALDKDRLDALYNNGDFSETVPTLSGEQQFAVYIRITDNAGNYTYVSSDGHIIDATESDLSIKALQEPNENNIYGKANVSEFTSLGINAGISFAVNVKEASDINDTYAGIQKITYEVKSRNATTEEYVTTQSGTLYDFSYQRNKTDNSNGGSLTINDQNNSTETFNAQSNVPTKDMLCREWAGVIVVDAESNNKCDVIVVVNTVDNAGNTKQETVQIDVDITATKINVSFDNNSALNEEYFNAKRTATVVFTERSHHFDKNAAEQNINDCIIAENLDGSRVENAYNIRWEPSPNGNSDSNTFVAKVIFEKDANYIFNAISVSDKAGNENADIIYANGTVAASKFTVDTKDPYGKVSVGGNSWSKFLDTLTFGLYSNSAVSVYATANDITSPVKVDYYKSNQDTGISKVDIESAELISAGEYSNSVNKKLYDISADEQFSIYVKITDKAGHEVLMNSDGFIVDMQKSAITANAVDNANEYGVYGIADIKDYVVDGKAVKGIKVHVDVNDVRDEIESYSGISSITYTVTSEKANKINETQKGVLYDFKYNRTAGENSNGGSLTVKDVNIGTTQLVGIHPTKEELKYSWSGDIIVIVDSDKNNSNNVLVTFTVQDNAGNVNKAEVKLDIDIDTPEIEVSFDNNTALNKKYFNAARQATVYITDRKDHFLSKSATDGIVVSKHENNNGEVAYEIGKWTLVKTEGDKETYKTTVSFTNDASYEWNVSYVGKSGNSNAAVDTSESVAPFDFTVDTQAPEQAEVSVNEYSWSKLLKVLTFGLFTRGQAEVKIEVSDSTSPYTIEYYKTNDPIAKESNELNNLYESGKFKTYSAFTVNPNEQFVVYAKVTDFAGNYRYVCSDGFIVDNIGAEIVLVPDEAKDNIYNTDVNIKVNVTEAEPSSGIAKVEYWVIKDKGTPTEKETQRMTLFNFVYTREEGENTNGGVLTITDWADGTEKRTELNGNVPTQAQLYKNWTGSFVVNSAINDSSNVEVYVGVTDNAGNYTQKKVALDIDVTDPSISVTYDDKANDNAKSGYYTEKTATVSITERTSHFDAAAATKGIVITAIDSKGKKVANPYTVSAWETVEGNTPDDAVHTATVKFLADANYTFDVSYVDKARNDCLSYNDKFTVDKTSPNGTVTAKSAEGRSETWSSIVDSLTFGFWSNTKITVDATCDDATSPIQSIEYFMPIAKTADENTVVLKYEELDKITEWKSFEAFDITENMQFTVYIKITDNAGNYRYIATNGLIVDEEHPVEESVAPEISVSPAKPINGIYSDDVKVAIEVNDPMVGGTYSGLKEISYAVFDRDSKTPDIPTQEGVLYTFDVVNPKQSDLKQSWNGEITVSAAKNNSNNIQIVVYAKDNSLNAVDNSQKESRSYTVIKIDKTSPVIDINYDNNNSDSGSYFNADRTATLTVTERNFNPDDMVITITNTDGAIPAVVGWTHTQGTYNNDDSVYIATIKYTADGDYEFSVDYTDKAGNKCESVKYNEGTVAGTRFTVDKTIPTVSVTYDNNDSQNSNYYNNRRTASIVINEHNFEKQRINISLTAQNNGAAAEIPTVNGWVTDKDTHTATIVFSNDAFYTFDIDFTDLAGNKSADYARDEFYVDNTDPVLTISPEELNGSANNGEVQPVVTVTDTNFDENQVEITLVGANNGKIEELNGSYSPVDNGRVFTFADFEQTKSTDDIYTLSASATDKSGRSTSTQVVFSVNRFGSVYVLDENTQKLNNAYAKLSSDVVFSEINANSLKNIKITMFKNNETVILKQGTDYTVSEKGGNGKWYEYVYTVFAANFAEDGVYSLSVHSEDEAGNVAENTLDTKDTEIKFGIDSTLPTVNVNNLESGETYAVDSMTVNMTVTDNLSLKKVSVYLDGSEYKMWSDEELELAVIDGGNFTFDIPGESNLAHNLRIVAVDSAGNEYEENINDFYVTTDIWVRFYNNKAVFYSSVAAAVLLAALPVVLVVIKRRKNENKSK